MQIRSAVATVLLVASGAAAHTDDPKLKDRVPRYEGPAYRLGDGVLQGAIPEFPANGVTLRAWLPIGEFASSQSANDCWGYTAPSGREYAILGLYDGTGYAEITNPDTTSVIEYIPGPPSLWHDIKTYQQYAYVVTEGTGAGIQVHDLSQIDNGVVTLVNTINTGGTSSTHNVAIDTESGFLYRTGGDGNGLRIYSLANPANPNFVGEWNDRYVHDAQIVTYTSGLYAGKQIAFCCSGLNNGWVDTGLDILDVTDKQNITTLSQIIYPNGAYSHQAWIDEDRRYLYLNDEVDENGAIFTRTHVFNITSLESASYRGWFENNSTAIGHNNYVAGDRLFQANYRSGLRIYDLSDTPESPEEIAFFDTWIPDDLAEFNGLWSTYPFFPSGTVIGSDIEKGLFVWTIDDQNIAIELPNGAPDQFATSGDEFTVRIEELQPGGLVPGSGLLHIGLQTQSPTQIPLISLGGDLYSAQVPPRECGAVVEYFVSAEAAGGQVITLPPGAPSVTFEALTVDGSLTIFEDTMESGAGYSVENIDLTDGGWDRGVPAGLGDRGDPLNDFDGSGACWLTDNVAGNSDVDGGPTRLTSPVIDASTLTDPVVSYARWFTNDDNDADRLDVEISNDGGASWALLESVGGGVGWQEASFRIADFIAPTNQMRFRFSATDNPNDSVTEAGIDALRIIDYLCDSTIEGDVDGDGDVDFDDLVALLAAWGSCSGPCPADFDGNGAVDFNDVVTLLAAWT